MHSRKIERNIAERVVDGILNEKAKINEVKSLNQNSGRQAYFEKTYKKIK